MGERAPKPDRPVITKWRIVSLALELGYIIALPLVALGLLGKWLDGHFNTRPWLTLVGIMLAIVVTTVWLVQRFKEMMK